MPDLALPSDAFALGDLTVVPSLNRIVRDGRADDLEPRLMRVLAVLAETPGEVVSRDALMAAVWGDAVVNDESLTRAVSELRRVLGDDARGAVETIRGTGYRLAIPTAPVHAPEPEAAPGAVAPGAARRRPPVLALAALALAAAALAVALWAAWPRPDRAPTASGTAAPDAAADEPFRLDYTSEYYAPGLSEDGVYIDWGERRTFRFVPDSLDGYPVDSVRAVLADSP